MKKLINVCIFRDRISLVRLAVCLFIVFFFMTSITAQTADILNHTFSLDLDWNEFAPLVLGANYFLSKKTQIRKGPNLCRL